MSDFIAPVGWLIVILGMFIHLFGILLGIWSNDYLLTWSIPLVGYFLLLIGGIVDE